MSIVNIDFGLSSALKNGDLVRVRHAHLPSGVEIQPDPHGIVVRISQLFRHGVVAGQARLVDVAVPIDDLDPEESQGWFILNDVSIDDLTRILGEGLKDPRAGEVLQFQCKADADRV